MTDRDKISFLLVDDKPENLLALESVLTDPDYRILKAGSGQEALSLLLEHDIALVLMDVQMPDMDGFETAELMRGLKKTRTIPIIFITAISKDEEYIFKGYQTGAVDYLFKPLDPHILLSKTRVFVELHRQKKQLKQQTSELEDKVTQLNTVLSQLQSKERQLKQKTSELEKANGELKDFAHIVSHDLKAPLRSISSLTTWIATDYAEKLDDEGRERLRLLQERVKRMAGLIDGILQYSRVGHVRDAFESIDLNELVGEAIDMVSPPENFKIKVRSQMPTYECERTRLLQVFQNLISNAVKYMDKNEGIVEIGAKDQGDCWRFFVKDNGPGIEERFHEKIFQIFQTLRPRDEVESTGVGLTTTKKIIELYGGQIWLESTVGAGSTFIFELPKTITLNGNGKKEKHSERKQTAPVG